MISHNTDTVALIKMSTDL